jgi:hypothetical protein
MANIVNTDVGIPKEVLKVDIQSSIVVEGSNSNTVTNSDTSNVVSENNITDTVVSSGGSQGPQGIQGNAFTYEMMMSGSIMSGHRMVTVNTNGKLIYADSTVPSHASRVIGIIISSVVVDELTQVYITGSVEEPSWTWDINEPIYLSTNGQLTQTPPLTGFLLIVGFPITSTKIFIDLVTPIILA